MTPYSTKLHLPIRIPPGYKDVFAILGDEAIDYLAPGQLPASPSYDFFNFFHCDSRFFPQNDPTPHGIISLPHGQYIMTNEAGDKRCVSPRANDYSTLAFQDLRACLGSDTPVGGILSLTYKTPVSSYAVFAKDESRFKICQDTGSIITSSPFITLQRN